MPLLRLKKISELTAIDDYGNEYVHTVTGWIPLKEWKEYWLKFWKNGERIAS
jgi:hypothetical protein